MTKAYELAKIKTIAEAGAIHHVEVVGVSGGWVVQFTVAMEDIVLRETKGKKPRIFTTLEGVGRTLRRLGVQRMVVNQENFEKASFLPV